MRYTKKMFNEEFSQEEISHMTSESIKAFIELKKLGCPIDVWYQNKKGYEDYRGFFWLRAEESEAEEWLDYWDSDMYWGSDKLRKILEKNGLYFEWQNSAVGCVYEL
jgi:hypothetical protein